MPGVTLVVDPITALIEDQVEGLRSYGIDRAASITSQVADREERRAPCSDGWNEASTCSCCMRPNGFSRLNFERRSVRLWSVRLSTSQSSMKRTAYRSGGTTSGLRI